MGVPKFYRWISERYPKINQIVSDSTLLPEFDNLYLDMNGILHTCTHPNDDGLSAQLSERDIILGIFHYIDRIVTHIVRPRKVLYMAIDGVAPRAKMNQQRSRRFRARKDMQEAKLVAESKGEVVDDTAVFDSNCITPGTEFMAKISRHLRYFVQKKITEDPLWKSLTVTFSGHEVPGEGEHKIMAYIRDERSAGRLPPNTRHCMYGQDADLILLGLVTHEPHFTLLREVVNFGQNASRGKKASKVVVKTTRDAQFQLLHLSVLREYVWAEFTRDMPEETEADMDRERVVDDFVFLTFLVGNDFLPHMPSLDIGEEAFSLLFQIYRGLKPGWGSGGYLTREGTIDSAERLEEFLREVGEREDSIFSERAEEEAEFRGRRRKTSKRFGRAEEVPSEAEIALEEAKLQRTYEKAMLDTMGYVPETADGGKDYKGRYYFEKFGITPLHTEIHERLQAAYVEGLLWCLAYYYRGCVSWGWFFPFHYVPMISDLTGLGKTFAEVKFDLGEPFLPFEQLLGCLPGASANFLPAPYGRLMVSPESPIIDFYPEDFEIDMNGKRNPWEAVNVLPFIDAYRLRAAVKELCPPAALSPKESERNTRGQVVEFYHDPTMARMEMSCNPEIGLADIPQCTAASRVVPFSIEPGDCFLPELPADSIIPSAGFPSLHVLTVGSVEERKVPVNCFGTASRYETLVLELKRPPVLPPALALAGKVLGRSAYLNWPLMHEAQVVGISDQTEEYRLKDVKGSSKRKTDVRKFAEDESGRWRLRAAEEQGAYITGRGVPGSGGVDIGKVQLMLKARPLQGMRVDPATGARRKVFGKEEAEVPVHMVLWSCPSEDPRFVERVNVTLEERFPIGSRVTCLHGGNGHGCGGEVVAYRAGKVDVLADLRPPEPPFGLAIVQSVKTAYFPQHKACQSLGIKPQVFGRIVGSVMVDPGKVDLGLNLKQNGRYQLLGYSRCILRKEAAWSTSDTVRVVGSAPEVEDMEASSWEFSLEAIKLITRYARAFPQLLHGLARHGGERFFEANTLLGQGGKAKMDEISKWLSELETAGLQRVPLTTRALSRDAVKAVERGADVRQAVLVKNALIKKTLLKDLEPSQLLAYDVADHTDAPMDTGGEKPDLGDRVVNMRAKGVPFGLWGTVVACHSHSGCVEVVFDEEFIGGSTLHGMCSNYRGALVPWATVAKIHTKARLQALRAGAGAAAPQAEAKGRKKKTPRQGAPVAAASGSTPKVTAILRQNAAAAKKQPPPPQQQQQQQQQRPAPTAKGGGGTTSASANKRGAGAGNRGVNAASTSALKGALGIGIGGGGASDTRSPQPPPPLLPPPSTSTPSTAAAAGAVLKGMLGVGGGAKAASPAAAAAASAAAAAAGGGMKKAAVPAGAAAVPGKNATADLKALIGIGSIPPPASTSPSPPPPPPPPPTPPVGGKSGSGGAKQPGTMATAALTAAAAAVPAAGMALPGDGNGATASGRGKETVGGAGRGNEARGAAGGRTITPPPPARVGGGVGGGGGGSRSTTPSRLGGSRSKPTVMSPEGSDRRAAASQYRQAKGPDTRGTGFRGGRGGGAGRGGGGGGGGRGVDGTKVNGGRGLAAAAAQQKSGGSVAVNKVAVAAAAAAAAAPAVSSSGGGGGAAGGTAEATVAAKARTALEEARADREDPAPSDTAQKAGGGSPSRSAAVAAAAATPVPAPAPAHAAGNKGQRLMSMIGAGKSSPQAAGAAAAAAAAAASAVAPNAGSTKGPSSGSGVSGSGGRQGGGAPAPPPPPGTMAHPRGQQQQQQQPGGLRHHPGGVLAAQQQPHGMVPTEFLPPRPMAGAGGPFLSGPPPPPPPPPAGGGAEGDRMRAIWQQQRMLEAIEHQKRQQQHQHLLQMQHQHALQQQVLHQQQRLQQMHIQPPQQRQGQAGEAGRGGGGYPHGIMPYQQYPHQAVLSYPRPPSQHQQHHGLPGTTAGAGEGTAPPASASNIIPKKPRKKVSAAGKDKGKKKEAAMMIPSSALLLAGSRRGSSASVNKSGDGDGMVAGGAAAATAVAAAAGAAATAAAGAAAAAAADI